MSILVDTLKDFVNIKFWPTSFDRDPIEGQNLKEMSLDMITEEAMIESLGQEDYNSLEAMAQAMGRTQFRNVIFSAEVTNNIIAPEVHIGGPTLVDLPPLAGEPQTYRLQQVVMEEWFENLFDVSFEWWISPENSGATVDYNDEGLCVGVTFPSAGQYRLNLKVEYTPKASSPIQQSFQTADTILIEVTE